MAEDEWVRVDVRVDGSIVRYPPAVKVAATEVLLKMDFISVQDLCDTLAYQDPEARVYLRSGEATTREDDGLLVEIRLIDGKIFLIAKEVPDGVGER